MKARKATITVKTRNNNRDEDKQISAFVFNHWGFHKGVDGSDYTITHIATGMALPVHNLCLQKKARLLTEMLEGMKNTWNGKGTPSKKFEAECLKTKNNFVENIA